MFPDWLLVPEYTSLVFVVIYIVNSLQDSRISSVQDVLFRLSLYLTLASIVADVFSTLAVSGYITVSNFNSVFLNSIYFGLTFAMVFTICLNLVALVFENRLKALRFRVSCICLGTFFALSVAVLIVNVRTGWIFSIDAAGGYVRGPINSFTYWYMLLNAFFIGGISLLERTRLPVSFRRIVTTLIIAVPVLAGYQLFQPRVILTGTVSTLTMTVLLIYGQQQRVHMDRLTMLAGREMLSYTLNQFVARRMRFHVVFISIRDFKTVNTRFGQAVGDGFLREIGRFLKAQGRRSVACRFSGVEFALVLPDNAREPFFRVFDRICTRFSEPWTYESATTNISSIIVEIAYPEHAGSPSELIGSLEYALLQAKAAKSGQVVRFSKQLRNEAGRYYYVLTQLTAAAPESYFVLLQPVHASESGMPVGAEVLLRLTDENGRVIMPGEFIPIAEETGRIDSIDWMVVEKACALLRDEPELGVEWLSINVTRLDGGQRTADRIAAMLREYGVQPNRLKLEVTERTISLETKRTEDTIEALRAYGVGVFIDDFGIGYSNLYRTTRLPLECIKIDKVFVDDVETDVRARAVLEKLIQGFSGLGFAHTSITVEGVETRGQRDIVRAAGAHRIQGYYYAKPMDIEAFCDYIKRYMS